MSWALIKVKVPATSANLGPGFDTLGLALDLHDEVQFHLVDGPTQVEVHGEGAGLVPSDENHLVLRAFRHTLTELGLPQPNVKLVCYNQIPQGSGLGSSAAAVVAGILGARELLARPADFDREKVLQLATEFEGHPDNAAPAIYGGATASWLDDDQAHAVKLPVSPQLHPIVLVPSKKLATKAARAVLPDQIPFADATFNIGRVALLVVAMNSAPENLFAATEDKLHQHYRSVVMPESAGIIEQLRQIGLPAVVSGAGPSVLVLAPWCDDKKPDTAKTIHQRLAEIDELVPSDWRILRLKVDEMGAQVSRELAR